METIVKILVLVLVLVLIIICFKKESISGNPRQIVSSNLNLAKNPFVMASYTDPKSDQIMDNNTSPSNWRWERIGVISTLYFPPGTPIIYDTYNEIYTFRIMKKLQQKDKPESVKYLVENDDGSTEHLRHLDYKELTNKEIIYYPRYDYTKFYFSKVPESELNKEYYDGTQLVKPFSVLDMSEMVGYLNKYSSDGNTKINGTQYYIFKQYKSLYDPSLFEYKVELGIGNYVPIPYLKNTKLEENQVINIPNMKDVFKYKYYVEPLW